MTHLGFLEKRPTIAGSQDTQFTTLEIEADGKSNPWRLTVLTETKIRDEIKKEIPRLSHYIIKSAFLDTWTGQYVMEEERGILD